jgi:hypothetical protein
VEVGKAVSAELVFDNMKTLPKNQGAMERNDFLSLVENIPLFSYITS